MDGVTAIAQILRMEGVDFIGCVPYQPLLEAAAIAGIRPIIFRQEGVIAPFPNLTSLDVDTHKGFTRVSSIVREIKWLWQYRLVTTAPLINLHPARWHGSLCCTARRYFLASI